MKGDADLRMTLSRCIERFEEAEDASRENREKAERDVDYYDGKQWTDAQARELQKRGQPVIVRNMIRPRVDFFRGLEIQRRTDPVALPRKPRHEEEAQAATDALRFVDDDSKYTQMRSAAWKDMLTAGWGGVEAIAEPREDGSYRVTFRQTPWDRMFWDPASSLHDFGDANYLGLVRWMDKTQAVAEYGEGADKVFDETISTLSISSTYDDKPKSYRWVDSKRHRIRVIQMYYLHDNGEWYYCEFTKGGYLTQPDVSPWRDDKKKPEHPYAWRSLNVDRDNNRYGMVRQFIDAQDEINKRASKFLHLVSVRQTFGAKGALEGDISKLRKELARPDGHIELRPGTVFGQEFGVIPTSDLAQGQFQLLQQSIADMSAMGPSTTMLGDGQGQSGRAIIAQQQSGITGADPTLDMVKDLDIEAFRKAWCRIRQFWTGETWVRVTDSQNNMQWVGLNVPAVDEFGNMVGVQNDVASLDVDIIIDDAPDVPSLQGEEFTKLVELSKAGVIFPKEVYLEASTIRNKRELIQKLSEQGQEPPEVAQMKMRGVEAEISEKEASTALKQAQAMKAQAEAQALMAPAPVAPEAPQMAPDPRIEIDAQKMMLDAQDKRDRLALDAEIKRTELAQKQAELDLRAQEFVDRRNAMAAQAGEQSMAADKTDAGLQEFAKAILALSEALTQQGIQQSQATDMLVRALTAPKTVVRDPKTGALRSEVVMN